MSGLSRNGRHVRSNSRSGRRRRVRISRRTPRKHHGQTKSCTISMPRRAFGGARMFMRRSLPAWATLLSQACFCVSRLAELGEPVMTIVMHDLAGADPALRFSPYCWRARMALAHKGLAVETIPWRFTEKAALEFSGQGRVPVIRDGARVVSDSWAIVEYLEDTYPDRPS